MLTDSLLASLTLALYRSGTQLLWGLGPLLLFALCMHLLSELMRRRSALLCGSSLHVWLTFPGVILHELGHAFFCLIFGHRIIAISLFRPAGDGVLGYVKHSWNRASIYQTSGNFFIGTGPIWFGSALIVILLTLLPEPSIFSALADMQANLSAGPASQPLLPLYAEAAVAMATQLFAADRLTQWHFWLLLYLLFCIGSHFSLSSTDLTGALAGFASGVLLLFLTNLTLCWLNFDPTPLLLSTLAPHLMAIVVVLLLVLLCNLLMAMLLVLLSSGRN
jgi:hypothetical protein